MSDNKFCLAYCVDNQDVAQHIHNHLSRVGYQIDHVVAGNEIGEAPLRDQLANVTDQIFIIISGNFLRNLNCMNRGLFMIQELVMHKNAVPIIAEEKVLNTATQQIEFVPTQFERMSQVIKYMNHWQDLYLELRKERRNISEENLPKFDEELKVVRSISSEMSEFLKVLKSSRRWEFEAMSAESYAAFFQAFQKPGLHDALKNAVASGEIPRVVVQAPFVKETSSKLESQPQAETQPQVETPPQVESQPQIQEVLPPTIEPQNPFIENERIELENSIQENIETNIPEIKEVEVPAIEKIEHAEEAPTQNEISNNNEITQEESSSPVESKPIEEDENLLKISEEKIRKEGKIPLLDKLIKHRQSNIQSQKPIPEEEPSHKDEVFENAVDKAVEEEKRKEGIASILSDPAEDLKSIFHDDDAELDSSEMISNFKLSTQKEEESPQTWQQKLEDARNEIKEGQIFNGLEKIEKLVDQNPKKTDIQLIYATHLLEDARSHDEAKKVLKKIIFKEDKNIKAYQLLAIIEDERGDEMLAKSYLEKALSIDEKNAKTLYSLGILLNTKFPELQDQAAKYLKKSIKIDDTNPDAHYRYGLILDEDLKKTKKAIAQFEKTLEVAPKHPFANYDLALIYYRLEEYKTAAEYYKKACEINFEFKTEKNDKAFLGALGKTKRNSKTSSEDIFKELDDDFVRNTLENSDDRPIEFEERISPRTPNFEKVVLITGATSGIGKATAELFAKDGFRIIITGRREERLAELKNEFQKNYPTEVQTLKFDVRKIDDAQAAMASLSEEWKSVDILINNAGLAKGFDSIHEGKLEDWETMIDTNVKGLLFMTRLISPGMVARRKGHIINVCSTAGHEVYPKGNVYCATKHAVDALTKGMRLDLYQHGLRVSQVSPAHVEETEFARVRFDWDTERAKIYEDFQPLKSEDVARTIYFIATQPDHVNIQDVLMMGKQQANSTNIDRSGR